MAEIHHLKTKPIAINWMCSACGVDAGCNCGAPLMSKSQRATEAIAASPQKSNRAIAEEVGVSEGTVRTARRSTAKDYAVEDDTRIGIDGKRRRMPVRENDPVQEDCDDCSGPADEWQHSLSNMAGDAISAAAFWSRRFGNWKSFETPSELVTLAKQAARAWNEIASELERR